MAIAWDPTLAADDLWDRLHQHFTEPQLVELGHFIALTLGQQRFLKTVGIHHGEVLAGTTEGLAPLEAEGSLRQPPEPAPWELPGMDDRDAIAALISDLHRQIDQLGPRGIKDNAENPYNPSYYKWGLQNAIDRGGLSVADYVRSEEHTSE